MATSAVGTELSTMLSQLLDGAEIHAGPHLEPGLRRRMQVVFQDPYGSFNPRHKVSRLITEPFHLLPDPPKGAARDTAIAEALTAVGLKPLDQIGFNDHDLRVLRLHSLRQQVAVVLQDTFLFNVTVRENLLYGLFRAYPDLARQTDAEMADMLRNG